MEESSSISGTDSFSGRKALALFGPGILLLAWFLPALFGAGFSWDDRQVLFENPAIRDLDVLSLFSHGYWAWHGDPPMFRPLASLSLSLDLRIFGPDPLWLHRSTLLLHGLSCLAMAWALEGLVRGVLPLAFLLFYLHPVGAEQAFWISGRSGVLMYLFLGLGLGLGIRGSREGGRGGLLPSLFFLFLASLSREDGLLGFALLFVLLRRERRLGFALTGLPFLLAWLGLRVFALGRFLGGGGDLLRGASLWERLQAGADWFAHALGMLLLLEPPRILSAGIPPTGWMRIFLPLFCFVLVFAFVRRSPRVSRLALFWGLLASLPFLRLLPLAEGLAGRYAFVLLPPIALGLGYAWSRLRQPPTWLLFSPLLLLPWTWKQWKTIAREDRAYRQVLEVDPGDRRARSLLANALESQGRMDQALAAYREMTRRFPRDPKGWVNLGNLLLRLGRREEGMGVLERTCARFPRHALAWLSLGRARYTSRNWVGAAAAFERALALSPRLGQAARYLCRSRLRLGQWKKAEAALRAARRIDPGHPDLPRLARKLLLPRAK
ncbi:MAG TPA: tetratricopeptide repeat protein [Planctomycetes bacterium]|nr:tetratricopeptide repeat protein [Planctomycetota bacterium]